MNDEEIISGNVEGISYVLRPRNIVTVKGTIKNELESSAEVHDYL